MTFSQSGDILYAVHLEEESREEPMYDSSFRTLDAGDYSPIATIDVKRCIYGLCSNKYDTQIAVVENARDYNSPGESIVRLYDVGRLRDDEDIGSEAEEEDEDGGGGEDDDGRSPTNSEDELEMLEDLVAGGGLNEDLDVDSSSVDDLSNSDEDDSDSSDGDDSNSFFGSSDDSDFDDELFSINADSHSSASTTWREELD